MGLRSVDRQVPTLHCVRAVVGEAEVDAAPLRLMDGNEEVVPPNWRRPKSLPAY